MAFDLTQQRHSIQLDENEEMIHPLQTCTVQRPMITTSRFPPIPSHHPTRRCRYLKPVPLLPAPYPLSHRDAPLSHQMAAVAKQQGIVDPTHLIPIVYEVHLGSIDPHIFAKEGLYERTPQQTVSGWASSLCGYSAFDYHNQSDLHQYYVSQFITSPPDPFGGNTWELFGRTCNFIGPLFGFCRGLPASTDKSRSQTQAIIQNTLSFIAMQYWCIIRKRFLHVDHSMTTPTFSEAHPKFLVMLFESTDWLQRGVKSGVGGGPKGTSGGNAVSEFYTYFEQIETTVTNRTLSTLAMTCSLSHFICIVLVHAFKLEMVDCIEKSETLRFLSPESIYTWCSKKLPQNHHLTLETSRFAYVPIHDVVHKVESIIRHQLLGVPLSDPAQSAGTSLEDEEKIGIRILQNKDTKSFAISSQRQVRVTVANRKHESTPMMISKKRKKPGSDPGTGPAGPAGPGPVKRPDDVYPDLVPSLFTHHFFGPREPVIRMTLQQREQIDSTDFAFTVTVSPRSKRTFPDSKPDESAILGRYFQLWQQLSAWFPLKQYDFSKDVKGVFNCHASYVPPYLFDCMNANAFVIPSNGSASGGVCSYQRNHENIRYLTPVQKRYSFLLDETHNKDGATLYIPRLCMNAFQWDTDEMSPLSISTEYWDWIVSRMPLSKSTHTVFNVKGDTSPVSLIQDRFDLDTFKRVPFPCQWLLLNYNHNIYKWYSLLRYYPSIRTESDQIMTFMSLWTDVKPQDVLQRLRKDYIQWLTHLEDSAKTIRQIWPSAWILLQNTYKNWDGKQVPILPMELFRTPAAGLPYVAICEHFIHGKIIHGYTQSEPDYGDHEHKHKDPVDASYVYSLLDSMAQSIHMGASCRDVWKDTPSAETLYVCIQRESEIRTYPFSEILFLVLRDFYQELMTPFMTLWVHFFTPSVIYLHQPGIHWSDKMHIAEITPHLDAQFAELVSSLVVGQNGKKAQTELKLLESYYHHHHHPSNPLPERTQHILGLVYYVLKHLYTEGGRSMLQYTETLQLLHKLLSGMDLPSTTITRDTFVSRWAAKISAYIESSHEVPWKWMEKLHQDAIHVFVYQNTSVALGHRPTTPKDVTPVSLMISVLLRCLVFEPTHAVFIARWIKTDPLRIPIQYMSRYLFQDIVKHAQLEPKFSLLFKLDISNRIHS